MGHDRLRHNRLRWLALAAPLMLTACAVSQEESGGGGAGPATTREVAMAFLQRAFLDNEFRDAYDRYAREDLIQHNPNIGDGLAGHRAYFERLQAANPNGDTSKWAHVTDMVLVDGDIFAVMHHTFRSPDDPGRIFIDLWRVQDGKIAEHWDVVQDIPTQMAHSNGMGCGAANDYASALAHKDSIVAPTCGVPDPKVTRAQSLDYFRQYTGGLGGGDVVASIERWFHPDYRQHSPIIADGKQGAIDYLMREYGDPSRAKPTLGAQRIVAEGDLVLVHYLATRTQPPSVQAQVDVFRFTDGKISEHWDFKQVVPEQRANDNGMW